MTNLSEFEDPAEVLNDLRRRIVEGDEPSTEEIAKGLELLRRQRERDTARAPQPRKPGRASKVMSDAELDNIFGGADANSE